MAESQFQRRPVRLGGRGHRRAGDAGRPFHDGCLARWLRDADGRGGAGNDTLYGGSAPNLLIGGLGSDTLYAGSAGDILIGGTTSYDSNLSALGYLMAEWDGTDVKYITRVGHLNGNLSGGLNGPYLLNAKTVHDDNATDLLYGGPGMDWFFAHLYGPNTDRVNGQTGGEVVTNI